MQTSLLNTDPLAAALDTWAFIFQMQAYMGQPEIKQAWGRSSSVVTQTLNQMDAQMEQLLHGAAPSADLANVRQKISAWAEEGA